MDLDTFLSSHVCIVSGKGGVGKTTISAVLARAAASAGRRVLLVEVQGTSALPALFGMPELGYEPVQLSDGIHGRTITAEQALLEFLDDHNLHWVSKRLQNMNLLEIVATAAPGLKDILVLGKVKQLEVRRNYDLIIVDAPAAGHALKFLGSAHGMEDAVRMGPVLTQAREVGEMLADPARASVVLVTLAEETPVNETVEAAEALVDLHIDVRGVIVNGWYPEGMHVSVEEIRRDADDADVLLLDDEAQALCQAAAFRALRHNLQREQLARLEDRLALPIVRLPYIFSTDFGLEEIGALVDDLHTAFAEKAA